MPSRSRPPPTLSSRRSRSSWSVWLTLSLVASAPLAACASSTARPPADALVLDRRSNPVPGAVFAGDYVCRTEGECAPCPATELHTPVCKLYGNRRALSCIPRRNGKTASSSFASGSSSSSSNADAGSKADAAKAKFYPADGAPHGHNQGEAKVPADTGLLDHGSGNGGTGRDAQNEDGDAAGQLADGSSGEEELQLAMDEVEDELRGAIDRRRRAPALERRAGLPAGARAVVDEAEYARLEKRWAEEVEAGLARRQSGVQLKVQAWEACPRVLKAEKEDFFEYILCNAFFAVVALAFLVYRQRALALRQYGRLAARIMQTEVIS
ncbi:hypothetical protein JCM10207_002052 [Rhodosporidiobolus poonsookiae]